MAKCICANGKVYFCSSHYPLSLSCVISSHTLTLSNVFVKMAKCICANGKCICAKGKCVILQMANCIFAHHIITSHSLVLFPPRLSLYLITQRSPGLQTCIWVLSESANYVLGCFTTIWGIKVTQCKFFRGFFQRWLRYDLICCASQFSLKFKRVNMLKT